MVYVNCAFLSRADLMYYGVCELHVYTGSRVKLVRPCQLQRIICSICACHAAYRNPSSRFHVVIAARASHQTFIVVYQSINQSINR